MGLLGWRRVQLPHEFETKKQHERSLMLPVGREWTTKEMFRESMKPCLLVKPGVMTAMAMSKPMA
jgi:U3 small nucleolar RNA-associated protein 14